jgi:hypothetical protein
MFLLDQAERDAVSKGRIPEEACIAWTADGRALIIRNPEELINDLLPPTPCFLQGSVFKLY